MPLGCDIPSGNLVNEHPSKNITRITATAIVDLKNLGFTSLRCLKNKQNTDPKLNAAKNNISMLRATV
jgi:hypothetical protein